MFLSFFVRFENNYVKCFSLCFMSMFIRCNKLVSLG